jgi:hypothetical protein
MALARARSSRLLAESSAQLSNPERDFLYEAIELHRWTCLWLLAFDADGPRTPQALVGNPGTSPIGQMATDEARWEAIRAALLRGPFDDANLPRTEAESVRDALRSQATELLALREGPERDLARAVGRTRRCVLALAFIAAVLGTWIYAATTHEVLGPNLAEGRPLKTSSTLAVCDPVQGTCGGVATRILFHTQEEDSPWVEIDLGDRKPIHRIDVLNRSDCCLDRATPLAAEISSDEVAWTEVARQYEPFVRWTARFPATQARYVRLRVPRRSFLHLEGIEIR